MYLEDGGLYAKFIDAERGEITSRLYPIGKKTFGRKGGFAEITFGKDCVTVNDGAACKKL